MLKTIDTFFSNLLTNDEPVEAHTEQELAIAAAALLVHCAMADGQRSPDEDAKLKSILKTGFELSDDDISAVISAAEKQEREALGLHQFTWKLHQNLNRQDRKRIVGWLWEMAQADGNIDGDESHIASLAARMLDVEVADSAALRQAAKRDG